MKEAARRHIPTAIHESNAVPGLTTKGLSKVVDRVMVGFEESRSHYDHPEKVVVTGTPVRGDFFRYTRQEAREKDVYKRQATGTAQNKQWRSQAVNDTYEPGSTFKALVLSLIHI